MTSFRYHVVSLLAVLLALAAGVALGGGPLSEVGRAPTAPPTAGRVQPQRSARLDAAGLPTRLPGRVGRRGSAPAPSADLLGRPRSRSWCCPARTRRSSPGVTGRCRTPAARSPGVRRAAGCWPPTAKSLVDTLGSQVAESARRAPTSPTDGADVRPDGPADRPRDGHRRGRRRGHRRRRDRHPEQPQRREADDPRRRAGRRASLVLVVLGSEPADSPGEPTRSTAVWSPASPSSATAWWSPVRHGVGDRRAAGTLRDDTAFTRERPPRSTPTRPRPAGSSRCWRWTARSRRPRAVRRRGRRRASPGSGDRAGERGASRRVELLSRADSLVA